MARMSVMTAKDSGFPGATRKAGGVGKLDAIFGSLIAENVGERYQDVTSNLALADGMTVSD